MEVALQLLREFGFPTFVCVWFMWRAEKQFMAIRSLLHKQAVLNAVIARTLDVPELPAEASADREEEA